MRRLQTVAFLALLPAATAAGGQWWKDDYEYLHFECYVVACIIIIAMVFDGFHHRIHHLAAHAHLEQRSEDHRQHEVHRDNEVSLWETLLNLGTAELMILGFIAFTVWVLDRAGVFKKVAKEISADSFALPPDGPTYFHTIEDCHMQIFLAMILYIFVLGLVAHGTWKAEKTWELANEHIVTAHRANMSPDDLAVLGMERRQFEEFQRYRNEFLVSLEDWRGHWNILEVELEPLVKLLQDARGDPAHRERRPSRAMSEGSHGSGAHSTAARSTAAHSAAAHSATLQSKAAPGDCQALNELINPFFPFDQYLSLQCRFLVMNLMRIKASTWIFIAISQIIKAQLLREFQLLTLGHLFDVFVLLGFVIASALGIQKLREARGQQGAPTEKQVAIKAKTSRQEDTEPRHSVQELYFKHSGVPLETEPILRKLINVEPLHLTSVDGGDTHFESPRGDGTHSFASDGSYLGVLPGEPPRSAGNDLMSSTSSISSPTDHSTPIHGRAEAMANRHFGSILGVPGHEDSTGSGKTGSRTSWTSRDGQVMPHDNSASLEHISEPQRRFSGHSVSSVLPGGPSLRDLKGRAENINRELREHREYPWMTALILLQIVLFGMSLNVVRFIIISYWWEGYPIRSAVSCVVICLMAPCIGYFLGKLLPKLTVLTARVDFMQERNINWVSVILEDYLSALDVEEDYSASRSTNTFFSKRTQRIQRRASRVSGNSRVSSRRRSGCSKSTAKSHSFEDLGTRSQSSEFDEDSPLWCSGKSKSEKKVAWHKDHAEDNMEATESFGESHLSKPDTNLGYPTAVSPISLPNEAFSRQTSEKSTQSRHGTQSHGTQSHHGTIHTRT